jgi:flagellar biosynthetic protein FlhB
MSRREVRREARDREGDPRLKQKRKQLHAEFSKLSQSLRNLKGADVVITNPEHIALALRYDRRTMQAPRVVSMGINYFARYIKQMALLYGIPVFENRPLARALYAQASLNKQIPDHCFQPVADIYNILRARAEAKDGEH